LVELLAVSLDLREKKTHRFILLWDVTRLVKEDTVLDRSTCWLLIKRLTERAAHGMHKRRKLPRGALRSWRRRVRGLTSDDGVLKDATTQRVARALPAFFETSLDVDEVGVKLMHVGNQLSTWPRTPSRSAKAG
jgi:hypothetical protein